MAHVLKNNHLALHIDLPTEGYNLSRFDWTGKITTVKFKGIEVAGMETMDLPKGQHCGRGLYNEFGIDSPLGFEETAIGGWFHKIGIGLLKKEANQYNFHKSYVIQPAQFEVSMKDKTINLVCRSQNINGYCYLLEKEIKMHPNGFGIHYLLKNNGEKPIVTTEYNHNFLAIHQEKIGKNYSLQFPFQLKPGQFEETVNPENKVSIGAKAITFNGTPQSAFFFSNLSGGKLVPANWQLENHHCKIAISETGDFKTNAINLWGCGHVISPELFYPIQLEPGGSTKWSRKYRVFEIS